MHSPKEDVDVYKMYVRESTVSKDEFMEKYNVNEKRTFRRKSRRKYTQFRI